MAVDAAYRYWTFRDCGSRFESFFERDRKGSGLDEDFGGMALGSKSCSGHPYAPSGRMPICVRIILY